jgi:hypothetical protein
MPQDGLLFIENFYAHAAGRKGLRVLLRPKPKP